MRRDRLGPGGETSFGPLCSFQQDSHRCHKPFREGPLRFFAIFPPPSEVEETL